MNCWRSWVLTLPLLAAGCTCGALDPATRFACTTSDDCAPDFVCSALECVPAGSPRTDAGTDAGRGDAGVDLDRDGYPLPLDCDDGAAAINPGAVEACANGVDDDCDEATDCQDPGCSGMPCAGGGTCMGLVCRALTEVLCADGMDNDLDGLIDCADPECPGGTRCDDFDLCTTGERCVADGGCQKLADVSCTTPPGTCFQPAGRCLADAGGCVYGPRTGACDDGLACTTNDACSAGVCSGVQRSCALPTNVCLAAATCREPPGACVYPPLQAGGCNDGQNCTLNDTCDGDGGCRGAQVVCTPLSQCHVFTGACSQSGACNFSVSAAACDAGSGAGSCNSSFTCVANPMTLFPYTPSNFTEAQLPAAGPMPDFTVNCNVVLDTTVPSLTTPSCVQLPPHVILLTTPGAEPTVLFLVNSLRVTPTGTLEVRGSRPAVFAVLGNVTIDGRVIVSNAGGTSAACGNGGTGFSKGGSGSLAFGGSGGGGFGGPGGAGGASSGEGSGDGGLANGNLTLIPLRGGCNGANGAGSFGMGGQGGRGGGALQLSAAGFITINGTLAAPGRGGGVPAAVSSSSGSGAGSGGALLLEAATLILGGGSRVTANGGGGSEASSLTSLGSAGEDGHEADSLPALGGSGGSNNTGNGGPGGAGLVGAGPGVSPSVDNPGGGGGGAVGRIRLNASSVCSVLAGAVLSPAASSNGRCP